MLRATICSHTPCVPCATRRSRWRVPRVRAVQVVLFSCVRSGRAGGLGFVRDIRRLNVAITRARHALYIVGSDGSLQQSSDWRALLDDARRRGCVRDVTLDDASSRSPARLLRAVVPLSLLDGQWPPPSPVAAAGSYRPPHGCEPPPCGAVLLDRGRG